LRRDRSDFAFVRMAHPGIVQKDEIAVVRLMQHDLALKRDVLVALLPDCGAPLNARNSEA